MRVAWRRLLVWMLMAGLLSAAPLACASPLGGTVRLLEVETEEESNVMEETSELSVQVSWDSVMIDYKWDPEKREWKAGSKDASFKFTSNGSDVNVSMAMDSNLSDTYIDDVSIGGSVVLYGSGSSETITVTLTPKALGSSVSMSAIDNHADMLSFTINLSGTESTGTTDQQREATS